MFTCILEVYLQIVVISSVGAITGRIRVKLLRRHAIPMKYMNRNCKRTILNEFIVEKMLLHKSERNFLRWFGDVEKMKGE